ncbi:hypothetical protein [Fluviicola sp.]|jgi:hypothetical protein|uniref:hypothetical protein n=1 Tax=Fluviicola sp. TaxID=1917219 RepID=UPI00282F35D3|nr:hypothetical protein [Fluviicola sp.]MDR0802694.1 hypothetical protein [Fluviicola sp.]
MKKLITFIGLIILSFSVNGQKDFNPFKSIGKEGKMLTLVIENDMNPLIIGK